jgi:predicted DNA-binding transcriptional regulator AlpA
MRENIYQLKTVPAQSALASEFQPFQGEVWTIEDIALHMRISKNSVYEIVNREAFPSTLGNKYRNRRWLARDVKEYFEKISKNPYQSRPSIQIEAAYEPSTIVFNN